MAIIQVGDVVRLTTGQSVTMGWQGTVKELRGLEAVVDFYAPSEGTSGYLRLVRQVVQIKHLAIVPR
jgi:hypothetical protein